MLNTMLEAHQPKMNWSRLLPDDPLSAGTLDVTSRNALCGGTGLTVGARGALIFDLCLT